jgi:tetratricopeptide (TPR) repeat protein
MESDMRGNRTWLWLFFCGAPISLVLLFVPVASEAGTHIRLAQGAPSVPGVDNVKAACAGKSNPPDATITACTQQIEAARSSPSELALAHHQRGLAHRRKGNVDAAIADFDASIRIDPKVASYYHDRGNAYRDKNALARAIVDYTEAIRLNPKDADVLVTRGDSRLSNGDLELALGDFTAAIRLAPNNAEAYRKRGGAYGIKQDRNRAIADYSEAIRLDPKGLGAYYYRAIHYLSRNDFDRSIADYAILLGVDPTDVMLLVGRGQSYEAKGDLDRARADFNAALQSPPKSNYSGSRGVEWARDTARARLAALGGATAPQAAPAADNSKAACAGNDSTSDAIIAACTQRITTARLRAPELAGAHHRRGKAYLAKRDYDRAVADFSEAIRLDPKGDANYYISRGQAQLANLNYSQAIKDFSGAIWFNKNDAESYLNRGNARVSSGDLERGMADYNESIRLDPKQPRAYQLRGGAYRIKEDFGRAIADYSEAIRLDPADIKTYHSRGVNYRFNKDFDRAVSDQTTVLRAGPTDVAVLTERGQAYEAKGDIDKARADYNAALRLPPNSTYGSARWSQQKARERLAALGAAAPPPQASPAKPAAQAATPAAPAAARAAAPPNVAIGSAGDRIALVIGNGAYQKAPALPNPANDARAVSAALSDVGFTVISATDLDNTRMSQVMLDFLRRSEKARMTFVYFAGHGVQIDGKNYLVPIDANELSRTTAAIELFDLERLLSGLDDQARANVVILDSCRDNPLEARSTRSGRSGAGLAGYSTISSGMLIAFATAPGKTAEDGDGAHSPFTAALLKHLKTPKLEINQMMNRVRADVHEATKKAQTPWTNSSLMGDVYLVRD